MTNLYFNLENQDASDINYIVNPFPDGQRSITINASEIEKLYKSVHIIIIKSIMDFKDLELIMSAASAIRKHTYNYSLYTPYVVGARSDRKFEPGGDMYFDDVIIPSLMMCGFQDIYTVDNHCYREMLNDCGLWVFSDFYINNDFGMVFPDESAFNRFSRFDSTDSCIILKKTRVDGKVTQVPTNMDDLASLLDEEHIVIFDDLFDGGASFVGLCEKFRKEYFYKGKLTIFVTHFVASNEKNLKKLEDLDVQVVSSNSYKWQNEYPKHTVIDLFDRKFLDEAI